jgi:hypothetical protein
MPKENEVDDDANDSFIFDGSEIQQELIRHVPDFVWNEVKFMNPY